MSNDTIVTMPPEVVRIRASSTVLVKASNRVNLLLAGIVKSDGGNGCSSLSREWERCAERPDQALKE